jgi:predicted RNA-binding protein
MLAKSANEGPDMNYWLDLFTGTTWKEFRDAGASVSGFRPRQKKIAARVKPGDVFICYLTGVMRWVGALEVIGHSVNKSRIWKDDSFPVRFDVKPLVLLDPESGVPMDQLEGQASFFANASDRGGFKGFLRGSLKQFKTADAELVLRRVNEAQKSPVLRPVDAKKLLRRPLYKVETTGEAADSALVSVPEPEEAEKTKQSVSDTATTRHTEIQYELLRLGTEMGLDIWVARNDRGRKWNGTLLGTMPRMLDQLPTQFNEATTRTIELIDVLWLSGNSIVAAFEVECTTAIYSGLLRMSDLLSLQPNLDINLYLVAPDDRREKVEQEILRPTFSLKEKPLAKVCGFLGFNILCERIEGIRKLGLCSSLRPTFLRGAAEYFSASPPAGSI